MEQNEYRQMNRGIRAFFDDLAPRWDEECMEDHGVRLEGIVRDLQLRPGDRVLDTGTGTGILLPILRGHTGANALIAALDISFSMLMRAEERADTSCICIQGDVLDLPLADAIFDVVLCNSVFPHFSDQQRGLAELARVLKPEGRIVICHTQSRKAINALHQAVGGAVGNHHLPPEAGLRAILEKAGFTGTDICEAPDRFVVTAWKK